MLKIICSNKSHKKYYTSNAQKTLQISSSTRLIDSLKKEHKVKIIDNVPMIDKKEIYYVHDHNYLESLSDDPYIYAYAFDNIEFIHEKIETLVSQFYLPSIYQVSNIKLAAEVALQKKIAVALGGGGHHTQIDHGEGFSILNGLIIVSKYLLQNKLVNKILIVDLDAHRGNGTASFLEGEENIELFDMYNKDNYPMGDMFKEHIKYNYPLSEHTDDSTYLSILRENFTNAIDDSKPDIVLYYCGADVLKGDNVGFLSLSKEGAMQRDKFVVNSCLNSDIPVVFITAGCYTDYGIEYYKETILELDDMLVN